MNPPTEPDPRRHTESQKLCASSDINNEISSLISFGATWKDDSSSAKTTVRTLSGIRYGLQYPDQSLDIYFPELLVTNEDQQHGQNEAGESSVALIAPLPVLVHVHGGGWSRGSKDNSFYGAPGLCQNVASRAILAVAIGYRRGKYPEFVDDAAMAVKWVQDNISKLGGDPSCVYLSGHSAGGHIASLLIVRSRRFLEPVGVSPTFFRGLVLISGVYDLFSPMQQALVDVKNRWFQVGYVLPAFGWDERLRKEASPLLLLLRESGDGGEGNEEEMASAGKITESIVTTAEVNTLSIPRTLILNASFDMGLQKNGKLMADAMKRFTDVQYMHVSWVTHAGICWSLKTTDIIENFITTGSS